MNPMVPDPPAYFRQWVPRRTHLLETLETEAQQEQIPIVGPVVGQLLYLLARLKDARRILELGTAIGYSTIFLAEACRPQEGCVVSLEIDAALARRARRNLAEAGLTQVAEVRCCDVLKTLPDLAGPMDMIFMDIEKADYHRALPECHRLLRSGGLLFADNTGFNEADPFNRAIHATPDWQSVNLWGFWPGHAPDQDGVCIAVKS